MLKIRRRDFFQRDSVPILVSRTLKTRKFKLLYFRNETCYGTGNLHKDLFFDCLQPRVNTNSQNLVILTLEFDDVTIYSDVACVFLPHVVPLHACDRTLPKIICTDSDRDRLKNGFVNQ